MKPVTKWNARAERAPHHPRGRAQGVQGRPGAEARPDPHRAARGRDGGDASTPCRCPRARSIRSPEPSAPGAAQGGRRSSARRSTRSCWPATASRASAPPRALREFARATGIGVAETFMGKGLLDYEDPHWLGTVGLQSRDYALAGFEDADVVITVGYDLVEHSPEQLEPQEGQEDRLHRHRPRPRSTSTSRPRSTWSATSTTSSPAWPRSCATRRTTPATRASTTSSSGASSRPRTTTRSRCSRRARCGRSATRSAARTC